MSWLCRFSKHCWHDTGRYTQRQRRVKKRWSCANYTHVYDYGFERGCCRCKKKEWVKIFNGILDYRTEMIGKVFYRQWEPWHVVIGD